jgi:hypothetical protein
MLVEASWLTYERTLNLDSVDDATAERTAPRLRQDRLGAFRTRYTSVRQRDADALPTELFGATVPETAAHQVAHRERVGAGSSTGGNDGHEYHERMHL